MVQQKGKTTLDKIKCPKCGKIIPVTEAFRHQLTEEARKELQKEREKQQQGLKIQRRELEEKEKKLKTAQENIEKQVQDKVSQERTKLQKEAKRRAEETVSLEVKDMRERLHEKEVRLEKLQKTELDLRKRERGLEEKIKNIELEVERKLVGEKRKIEEESLKRITEEYRFKNLEKEKQINDMRRQIEDLKRKADQGSQQLQGEVQELDLETFLKEHFIFDDIQPVPKGTRGADVFQKVYTKKETPCGSILWEAKRTKNWVEGWITKLKEDQREAKADIAAIVSDILPKDISNFGFRNGVWITNRSSLLGLAFALRTTLTQVAFTKLAAEGKDEKIELLFRYLTGPEFKQRVEAMIETFIAMKQELDKEKRITMTRWGKQEKQIERMIAITSGMHGDLKGLIGASMQSIPALESGEEEEVDDKERKEDDNKSSEDIDVKDIPF